MIQPPKSDAKPQHSLRTVAQMWKINENDLTCFVAITNARTNSLKKIAAWTKWNALVLQ
jgi:siderophore synthetase component